MEEREWTKTIRARFDNVDFCFVEEVRASQAFDDVDKVRVTFEFWSTRNFTERQKQEKTQELAPTCHRLIKEYPRCMFTFCYLNQHDRVVFLESPLIPEPVKPAKPVEYYRGLPRITFNIDVEKIRANNPPEQETSLQSYSITLTQLCKLLKRPTEYVLDVLTKEGLSVAKVRYLDLMNLTLDHRITKQHTEDGKFKNVLLVDAKDGWNKAPSLIDKTIFSNLYEKVKQKSDYKCQCCGEKGVVIHHIDGDHWNMVEDNLAFLCNGCHYELHRDWLQRIKGDISSNKSLDTSLSVSRDFLTEQHQIKQSEESPKDQNDPSGKTIAELTTQEAPEEQNVTSGEDINIQTLKTSTLWYKTWWGILIIVNFVLIILIYLAREVNKDIFAGILILGGLYFLYLRRTVLLDIFGTTNQQKTHYLESVIKMKPREFEVYCVKWLRRNGYKADRVRFGNLTAFRVRFVSDDYKRYIIVRDQNNKDIGIGKCKVGKSKAGEKHVKILHDSIVRYGYKEGWFFSLSGFSDRAKDYVNSLGGIEIKLIEGRNLI